MANGILIIDKSPGWTSMDVCAKLRGFFQERRVGHAGTLDPMATGVLPIFIGRATRAVEFAADADKEYVAGLKLGIITNTQDTTGQVLEERPVNASPAQLEEVLSQFRGDIQQIPPMYSAIKIGGKKLYELARKGREVERKPRPVTIRSLNLEQQVGPDEFILRIRCTKGTYIRTLCHDIGLALGCGGTMSSLRRTMAAGFTLEDAVCVDEVLQLAAPTVLLRPVDSLFSYAPSLTVPPELEKQVRNGMAPVMPDLTAGTYRVYGQDGAFLALSEADYGTLKTIKSFFEV